MTMAQVGSFRALDTWMKLLNEQTKGSIVAGHKAERMTFASSGASSTDLGTRGLRHHAEGAMYATSYIDWSQGDITTSFSGDHYGIKGEGLFAVARSLAAGEAVHFTRNGEFHKDDQGYYRDIQGNYLLNAEDIDPMGLVTRDPVAFGRPYPDPMEPFPPGATGVTDDNFAGNTTVVGNYVLPLTGAAAVNVVDVPWSDGSPPINSGSVHFGTAAPVYSLGTGGPSPTQWMATATTAGNDDSGYTGGVNHAGENIGWQLKLGNGAGASWGLYYGSDAANHYATGTDANTTLDYMLDWQDTPAWHDVDISVVEADGSIVTANSHYDNGFLNRDNQNGMRPGGASYADWDEWYHLDTLRANDTGAGTTYDFTYDDNTYASPSYAGAVAAGAYQLQAKEFSGIATSVDWQIVEDPGTFREEIRTGTQALAANGTVTIETVLAGDRSHQGEVTSPEYDITGLEEGWVYWDQKSQVESLGNVDTMTFQYRYDGGAWSAPIDAKSLTANDGNYATIPDIVLPGFAGHSTVQFKFAFDTVDGKNNTGYGWSIDNFNVKARDYTGTSQVDFTVYDRDGALTAGDRIEIYENASATVPLDTYTFTAGNIATMLGGATPVNVNLPITDNPPPAASKWPLTNAVVRFVAGATGATISENTYSTIQIDEEGEIYLASKRGFEAALYDDYREEFKEGTLGVGYYDALSFTNLPTFMKWDDGTQPATYRAGSLVKHAVEASNANQHQIAQELVMAQRMYEGLTRVLQAHKDITLSLIDAIR